MPQTNPDISFVMPCYKDGKTLYKAVHSLLDQDWQNIEVIIVNDGSPDDSNKVIDKLEKQDNRVRSLRFKKNQGACVARNAGAKIAKGRYLSFLPADAFLYPGNIRVWVEGLDNNKDVDFMYGGYRFVKELSEYGGEIIQEYKSEQFDPYILETANYIDGSFPMRREVFEKVGGWSVDVKSLQDWDLWLKIVKSGSKGLFFGDMFFETEYPHPGGLSFDSSANWLERTKYIKKKNGIPLRKYCVASLGAGWHAKNVARILNADFSEMPAFKPHEYEAIYAIGYYPQFADLQFQIFQNSMNIQDGLSPAKKIIHFVGTDIFQLQQLSKVQLDIYRRYFAGAIDVILCEDKFTQDELKELKINAEIVPIPPIKGYKLLPLPKEFTVACYLPATNAQLYQPELMEAVAKEMPEVQFKFFGAPEAVGVKGNIEYCGYLARPEMDKLVKNSSCLLRMPTHDGLSINSIEFLQAGRQVVSSTPVKHSLFTKSDKRLIINAIRKAQKLGLNRAGSKYWVKEGSHTLYKKRMLKYFQYDPKGYWEKRAENWDKQVGETLPDLNILEPIFLEYKPKSVLDVGCGNGRWYPYFKQQGVNYRGIDIADTLVAIAQDKWPDGMFKACRVEDIPRPPKKFDMAFCYTTLEHVTEENFPMAVRSLKQAAKIIVLVEPINFQSRHYCHDHQYNQYFNIIKTVKLQDKMVYVCKS